MGSRIAVPVLAALVLLCGCDRGGGGGMSRPARHGRYAGIGVFEPGMLWSRMALPKKTTAPQAATTADDEHIIVVVDTETGEVRECGDHSGYCTAMNPWTQAIAAQQQTPVTLTAHAADLAHEAEAAGNTTEANGNGAVNQAAPSKEPSSRRMPGSRGDERAGAFSALKSRRWPG